MVPKNGGELSSSPNSKSMHFFEILSASAEEEFRC